jgi:transposase-like protein
MNLLDVSTKLTTDEQCIEFLEKVRWPDGVRCTVCGGDKISRVARKNPGKNRRLSLYTCLEPTCKTQFSVTTGSMFHDSHLPLHKWFMAVALMVDAKKGMSANQMMRHLKVSYRTAWYLAHRIRKAMEETGNFPLLAGTVEVDETYIGGRQCGHKSQRKNKDVVIGIRERGGPLRFIHAEDATSETLYKAVSEHVSPNVEQIVTDENPAYNFNLTRHRNAKHSRIRHKDHVYVRGDIYTNTVESAFSLLKRGIVGSFHKISTKHLHRYLSEFQYRFDRRESPDLFGSTVARLASPGNMKYEELIAK